MAWLCYHVYTVQVPVVAEAAPDAQAPDHETGSVRRVVATGHVQPIYVIISISGRAVYWYSLKSSIRPRQPPIVSLCSVA